MPSPQKILLLALGVISLSLQIGCATILKGTHQEVPVASEPSRASVMVDGVRQGTTPTKLNLARKSSHVITIELQGYESESVTVKPSMGGAVAGNIIAGGLIGWGVDAGTGAQYNLNPDSVNVRLRPKTIVATESKSRVDEMLNELAKLEKLKDEGKITSDEYPRLRANILKQYQ